jgi:hypothetical protein
MTASPQPIPDFVELPIDGGTYTATPTFLQVDKAGQWFRTSMSAFGIPSKKFGIHLWYRKSINVPWQLIQYYEDSHGVLTIIGNDLFFIVNRPNGTSFMTKVKRWQGVRT